MRIPHIIALGALALALAGAAPTPRPTADPGALQAVTQYVAALSHADYAAAYGLLTSAQQRYFGDVNNFASNSRSTKYVIHKYSIIGSLSHGNVVEAIVRQETSFVNLATGGRVDGSVREPFFALRENGAWRVKQLSQPWKAYAVGTSGSAQGVEVTVYRVEFYDKRIEVDCTIRNGSKTAVQVLPLGKSVLDDGANKVPAMNERELPAQRRRVLRGISAAARPAASGVHQLLRVAAPGRRSDVHADRRARDFRRRRADV